MKKKIRRIVHAVFGAGAILSCTQPVLATVPDGIWDYSEMLDDEGHIVLDFKNVELMLPAEWYDQFGMEFGEDYITFYQTSSREACAESGTDWGDGNLFSLNFSRDKDFTDYLPDYSIIGKNSDGFYYLSSATDVRGYQMDETILSEWQSMMEDYAWIAGNASMLEDSSETAAESSEYLLRDSSSVVYSLEQLNGMRMDKDMLQMAINEIYARHGRRFVTPIIQDYFDRMSWYKGTISAADFDPSCLSQTEQQNISNLLKAMQSAQPGRYGIAP